VGFSIYRSRRSSPEGIAFNWNWLTVSELVRLLTALPCMLMMFKCLNCRTSRSGGNKEVVDRSL
jgi:hypothetical protein